MIKFKHFAVALILAVAAISSLGTSAYAATCSSTNARTLKQTVPLEWDSWVRTTANQQYAGSGTIDATVQLYYGNCGTAYRKVAPVAIVVCVNSINKSSDPYYTGLSPSLVVQDQTNGGNVHAYLSSWTTESPALSASGCTTYSDLTQTSNVNGALWWYFTPDNPEWRVTLEPNPVTGQGISTYYKPSTGFQLFDLKKSVLVEDWV